MDKLLERFNAPDFVFAKNQDEKNSFDFEDLIEMQPYGVSLAQDIQRPFLLLKNEKENLTLPVALNNLEAGIALSQSNKQIPESTPHRFTEKLLESLNIQISKCVFCEIKGHSQYVRLHFDNHPQYGSLKLRAEECMSLCLQLGTPFYATRDFVQKSKVMSAEIEGLSKGIKLHSELQVRTHPYLM